MAAWFNYESGNIGMGRHLDHYSSRIYFGVFILGGLALSPFALWHLNEGNLLTAAPIAALVLVFWGVDAWSVLSRQRIGHGAILFVTLFCNFVGLFALVRLREMGIYWIYPMMLAVAFLVPCRWSTPINIANVIFTIVFAATWMPEALHYRLIATLLLTMTFTVLFSYNIERQQQILKDQAIHDPLTGAFNRRHFDQKLDQAYRLWKRAGQRSAMIMIDIDFFKAINDTHGHAVGDQVLTALSQYIIAQLRPSDYFFRLGGEEFALVLPNTSAQQAALLAERLRRHFDQGSLDGIIPAFTISCGVAGFPECEPPSRWVEKSDEALYAAKKGGRNLVVITPASESLLGETS